MAANPTKLDYSRLLDDEFLNRGERVRVHTVTRGAATVLGSTASLELRGVASGRCTTALLKVALALALMAALTFVALLIMAHQHHGHLRALAMPMQAETEARPSLADHAKETAHHLLSMAGDFEHSQEEDPDHPDFIHEHVLPGDVVVEDHHIVPADEPDPTRHVVVVCLPLATAKQVPTSTPDPTDANNATATATATATGPASPAPFPLHLTRHQRDVVQSVAEYLSASARCHVVVLRGAADEDSPASSTASPTASSASAATVGPSGIFGHFSHTGCGAWSSDDEDDAGAAPGGSLSLPGGKVVPVVLWDARTLFARSPLAEVWQDLPRRSAKGEATSTARASTRTDLLDLAARLQLLWQYGGISVDLQSSADQVLKTLSAFNRTDSTHVYLETTRSALLAAPQTCSSVVFDLINAIAKRAKRARQSAPRTPGVARDDDGDVRVFDGVLNDYCRGKRTPRLAHQDVDDGEDAVQDVDDGENAVKESSNSTASNTTAPTTTSRSNLLARLKGAAAFGQLRAGPPASTTTPHPDPQDIQLDVTQCRGNLVAISLTQ